MWKGKPELTGKVTDMTCNHQCSRCGSCCGLFIPFTEKELNNLKQYVRLHDIKPYNRINKITGEFKAHCCFYNEDEEKCMVYPVRPYACRDFKCDRKDWKRYRDKYELRAKYNSSLSKKCLMGTFDDLIYNDVEPIIRYLMNLIPVKNNDINEIIILNIFKEVGRVDLLQYISFVDDRNNTITGTDLLNKYN